MESILIEVSGELAVPASWVRGGTSKCWIFEAGDVDALPVSRDEFLLRAFGSPDYRQIDGIGGATSTTSKSIIVEAAERGQQAVRYSFAQVSVDHTRVEWMSNCGNCATALALYAVQHGLVELDDVVTEFVLVNHTNDRTCSRGSAAHPRRGRTLTRRPARTRCPVPRGSGRPDLQRRDVVDLWNTAPHRPCG
jgi:hypothetical protein